MGAGSIVSVVASYAMLYYAIWYVCVNQASMRGRMHVCPRVT